MNICTFFGHRDTPDEVEPLLRLEIIRLIEQAGVKSFYVGNQGNFDIMARKILKEMVNRYEIEYSVVLAYMPGKKDPFIKKEVQDTIFPTVLENVPRKFAISHRNRWMVEQSDYVITYITHGWGGAAQFRDMAMKKGKVVIDIKNLNIDKKEYNT